MSVHFNEGDMAQLVEIYKDHDCLWNMKHESYRDNEARQAAYKDIAEKLNIPNLKYKDIPIKIKNLRSSYYQEIKRIRRSVRLGGPVYTPKVSWFSTVDGFLKPFRHEHSFISKRKPTKVMRDDEKNDNNKTQKQVKKIDQIAASVTNNKNEDEFDTFGKYIASSLRSMPQEFSIIAKTELQKTISDIQLKIVRQNNAGCNNQNRSQSPCGSETSSTEYEIHTGSYSPASDSGVPTIKIEYDN